MATDKEILREFLVSLGVQVDPSAIRKFTGSLDSITKFASYAGKALAGVAVAAEAMVVAFSSQMERLYYASRRSGSSVENLRAIGYAAAQVGMSAEDAQKSVEAMMMTVRTNKTGGLLSALIGYDSNSKDPTQVWLDLLEKLKGMDFAQASRYGSILGQDPQALLQYIQNLDELKAAYAAVKQQDADMDWKKAAETSKDYMNTLRDIGRHFGVLAGTYAEKMKPMFQMFANDVSAASDAAAHFQWDRKSFQDMFKALWEINKIMGEIMGNKLVEWWGDLVGLVTGRSSRSAITGPQFGGTGSVGRDTGVRPIGGAGGAPAPSAAPADNSNLPLGLRLNNPGNIRGGGWSAQQDSKGFDIFDNAEKGLSALAGQLIKYGNKGVDTIEAIVNKYAPASDNNNVQAYIADVMKNTGFRSNQLLDLKDPETLTKLMGAIIKHEQGFNPYPKEMLAQAAASRGAVQMTQTNHITVAKGDPKEIGRAVGGATEEALRNTRTALVGPPAGTN